MDLTTVVSAGSLARKMGLPIKLVGTVNSNDYLVRMIETGVYSVEGTVIQSVAPAMDIQVRLLMAVLWERMQCLYYQALIYFIYFLDLL